MAQIIRAIIAVFVIYLIFVVLRGLTSGGRRGDNN